LTFSLWHFFRLIKLITKGFTGIFVAFVLKLLMKFFVNQITM